MDKDLPLRNDIRRLGDLLGETLKRFGSKNLFATEERVRALCKQLRARHHPGLERNLMRLLQGLDLDEAIEVIRAFSVYFQLINIAEQYHRIRRKRFYELHTPDEPQRGSIAATLRQLKQDGRLTRGQLQGVVDRLEIIPGITANTYERARSP